MVEASESILASIGKVIAPMFKPLGFGNWMASVATIIGLVAKEIIVATYGILAGLGEVGEDHVGIIKFISTQFNAASAYSFMVFTLLSAPCVAAIVLVHVENRNLGMKRGSVL